MENEQQQSNFEGWAIVEMYGHNREIGFVATEHYGAASLFRIDTPELPERDYVLARPEYVGDEKGEVRLCPVGTKVRRQAVPAKTKLIGPGSIYAMTPCTQETAIRAMEELIRREPILLELPKQTKALPGTKSKKNAPVLPGEFSEGEDGGLDG